MYSKSDICSTNSEYRRHFFVHGERERGGKRGSAKRDRRPNEKRKRREERED
jgi:hypothetical protein